MESIGNIHTSQRSSAATSWNAAYLEEMYERWQKDPSVLPETWQIFFQGFDLAMCPRNCVAGQRAHLQSQVASLIYAYRSLGHLVAAVDPLNGSRKELPELDISEFEFSEEHLDYVFDTGHMCGPKRCSLKEIVQMLRNTYCGSIGVEYIHIQERKIRRWLQKEMEPLQNHPQFDRDKKLAILEKLVDAEIFETFLHTHYPGQKRFSLEGAETLIPALHAIVHLAPEAGVEEIVLGMSHRGRLNVLANILDKSYAMIFTEFDTDILPESYGGDGDVKYHKGFSSDLRNRHGHAVHVSLTANPSHLEAVDPVVEGRARAKQRQRKDWLRKKVLPLLIHGDAAFAAQGLVAETLNLSQLQGYSTGGTVHVIVNNQIGFTTSPQEGRSYSYSTDIAKAVEAPIFHVNGDDPEAVVFAGELALRFRQQFGRDVVVDMICYRRHGHNESDEPAFTQPLLYQKIKDHLPVRKLYTKYLLTSKTISPGEEQEIARSFEERLEHHYQAVKKAKSGAGAEAHPYEKEWAGLDKPYAHDAVDTAVALDRIFDVADTVNTVPDGFNLNPKIARYLSRRKDTTVRDGTVDWPYAESLAFGTLLLEGTPIRLSGQDSVRGTFSQRHCIWYDMKTTVPYIPLNNIAETQSQICAYNSPLSEAAVLGFDYGYSLSEPRMLILWEAQFGDFANGAQVIIDQFIMSSQAKWQRTSGLVMLLPHGYEGQGPEHSNAYLERYLLACAQENVAVCNLTTPAQYFHALRRQIKRPFRRPLVIMAPKSLLRHPSVVSPVAELAGGRFREILDDPASPVNARRLILCSGKIFYDLYEERQREKNSDVAIVRIEQIYPFHNEMMLAVIEKYQAVEEIVWAQEESKNRGAWGFIRPWLQYLFPSKKIRYIGRGYSASPATGSLKRHEQEQKYIVDVALHGDRMPHDITILPEGAHESRD